MKMKRGIVQVTIEYPADADPVSHIKTSGGQLFMCTGKKLIEEVDLGDVYPPSIQKKDEFLIARKIINDGIKKAMPKIGVIVYGQRNSGEFTYWAQIELKARDFEKIPQPADLRRMVEKYRGHTYAVSKGTLYIRRYVDGNQSKVTTMSLGNPNIVDEIAAYVRKVIQ